MQTTNLLICSQRNIIHIMPLEVNINLTYLSLRLTVQEIRL